METPHSVLLIEDDEGVAVSLADGVGREGYEVHWEATARGGVAYAREHNPHLIILDVRLPDGSGFDVCRELRSLGLHQPILMLTVQSDELDKVLGLEMGADDYLTKPYRLRELVARIRSLLRRAYGEFSSSETDLHYCADLVIDRNRGSVSRAGRDLGLTPTEYRILALLVSHPGQVFSRAQIIEHVWGEPAEFHDEKSVNVHIRRLREKVEAVPSDPMIVLTVPGFGYRLAT